MSRLDYSKWDHIEVSDDEDDTHPNIDTASLHRWRHEARVQRMEQKEKDKQEVLTNVKDNQQKLANVKRKIRDLESVNSASDELEKLKIEAKTLQQQEDEWLKKEEELKKKERLEPWNIDTICKDGKSKTILNKEALKDKPKPAASDDDKFKSHQTFVEKNADLLKKFAMLRKYEDSERLLIDHPELVCDELASWLTLYCLDLEMEEKHDLADHVAHQTICIQFLLELANTMKVDPRGTVRPFFAKMRSAEVQYMSGFNDELEAFRKRIRARALEKREELIKEYEEEERNKRLGPGGLDPIEVFETLPVELQECFENKDLQKLQEVIQNMPPEDAKYHMKRCVDSGMWVPSADNDDKTPNGNEQPCTANPELPSNANADVDLD